MIIVLIIIMYSTYSTGQMCLCNLCVGGCVHSLLMPVSYRKALLHSTLLVQRATRMWWTLSSGQEPVSNLPARYGDCTTQCSVFVVHSA